MRPILSKRMVRNAANVLALSLLATGLFGCGGGGGGSSENTARPKSMEGIVLKLGGNSVQFEFLRNTSSPPALNNGEEETGTFIYTSALGLANFRTYPNTSGTQSNFWYPTTVRALSYKYRAVNDNSGTLTLEGTGTIQNTFFTGIQDPVNNDSRLVPFVRASRQRSDQTPTTPGDTIEAAASAASSPVEIDLTFSSDGSSVTIDTVTLRLPESDQVQFFDTVRIPAAISLLSGGSVPVNYNPTVDTNRVSKIAPASLNNMVFRARNVNNQTEPPADLGKDFTIQLVADSNTYTGTGNNKPDEIGHGLLRINGTLIDLAVDYTWRRINGTDNGEFILSNIPDDPSVPFAASLNGTYTLFFQGANGGTYVGTVDANTTDVNDVTGTFIILSNS